MTDSEYLNSLFDYSPKTGLFSRKKRMGNQTKGAPAFTTNMQGYKRGSVNGFGCILAHRAAWCMVHGEWPNGQIDHIDGDRSNNKLSNLRVVSNSENQRNAKKPRTNTSGYVGVFWAGWAKSWLAQICVDGRTKKLGYFKKKSEAVNARKAAEAEYGFHKNHGR